MKPQFKLAILVFGIIFLAGLLIVVVTQLQMAGLILQGARGNLDVGSQLLVGKIIGVVEGKEDNIRYLANLYLMRNYLSNYLGLKKIQLERGISEQKISEQKNKLKKIQNELEKFLGTYVEEHPYYSDIRLINLEGWEILRMKNGAAVRDYWDVSRTDLFKKINILKTGELYRSELELETGSSGKDFVAHFGAPVVVDDRLAGFLVVRADFYRMGQFLAQRLVNPVAALWLIDPAGRILMHPDRAWMGALVSEIKNGEIKQFIKGILINESGRGSIQLGGENFFLTYRPVAFKNWKILLLIPERGLLTDLERLRWEQLVIIVLAFLVLLGIFIKFIEREFRSPLKQLVTSLRDVSDEEAVLQIKESGAEIDEIVRTLQTWFKNFRHSKLELREKDSSVKKDVQKLEEKYQRVMRLATAFLELVPEHNLQKTLKRLLDDLKEKLNVKSAAVVLKNLSRDEEIFKLVSGLEVSHINSFEELKTLSVEVPFEVTSKIGGCLYLPRQDLMIEDVEKEFLRKLGPKVGKVVREALHHEEKSTVDSFRFENQQAKVLKEKFFQIRFPKIKGFEFGCFYLPAAATAGSFANFISFPEEGYLDLTFGEIPGEGLKAAVEVGVLKGLLKSRAVVASSPAEIVTDVNRLVFDEYSEMTPTSLSYNMIDLGNRTISTVNVGEVYLAYFQKDSQKLATLKADLLGLGSQREIKVTPRKIILTPDDLLIYLNKQFVSFYGFERLKSFLVSVGEASLETVAAALKEDFIMALGEKKLPRDVLVLFLRVD